MSAIMSKAINKTLLVFDIFFAVNTDHIQTGQVDLYGDTTTDNFLKLERHVGLKDWADELWKLATAI